MDKKVRSSIDADGNYIENAAAVSISITALQ